MRTGFNFDTSVGFTIINVIADITLKLIYLVKVENFVDFAFKSKAHGKFFFD